jgi:hypothetical protein
MVTYHRIPIQQQSPFHHKELSILLELWTSSMEGNLIGGNIEPLSKQIHLKID